MRFSVVVKDANGVVSNFSEFDSEAEAQAWIDNCEAEGLWPEPHTVDKQDITAEYEAEQADEAAIERGLQKQTVGARAIAMLNQVHEEMGMTAQQLAQLAADQQLMLAITLVRNGAIKTGRDIFEAAGTAHYTPEQIARIVKPINDSGLV